MTAQELAALIQSRSPTIKPGLDTGAVDALQSRLGVRLPDDVRDLLSQVGGYEIVCKVRWQMDRERVSFSDATAGNGYTDLFPAAMQLLTNGCGDWWILDIDPASGQCGPVVLCSHDPPSIRFHFQSLEEFIQKTLDPTFDLRQYDDLTDRDCPALGLPAPEARQSTDPMIREFAETLGDNYHLFDIRGRPLPCGFCRALDDPRSQTVRWRHELLFASERKPAPRSGLWNRVRSLLGRGQ